MCNHSSSSYNSAYLSFPHLFPDLDWLTALSYRSEGLEAYLTEIVKGVSRLIQSDWTIVTVTSGDAGKVIASSLEMDLQDSGFTLHNTLVDEVVKSKQPIVISNRQQVLSSANLPSDYLAYLGVPLRISNGEVIGTICSFLRQPRSFLETEVNVVTLFADRAAIAIENYQLYQHQLRLNEYLTQVALQCSHELKKHQEQFLERERLAAIGEFTAMIVHEVRNPLTTIEMGLEYAARVLRSEADQERLALAVGESHRLNRLLQEILTYAKPQVLSLRCINIVSFLGDIVVQAQEFPEANDKSVDFPKPSSMLFVMADPDKLKQVFVNLFKNAFEAIPSQETVTVQAEANIKSGWIQVQIHNKGKPIPPDLLPQLTTPFCSTKPSGTGLGLAISKRIITAHQGEFSIVSSKSGTTVSVYLPLAGSAVNDESVIL
jgi:signal transduction histidine kinase